MLLLGYLDDVDEDELLPAGKTEIAAYWRERQRSWFDRSTASSERRGGLLRVGKSGPRPTRSRNALRSLEQRLQAIGRTPLRSRRVPTLVQIKLAPVLGAQWFALEGAMNWGVECERKRPRERRGRRRPHGRHPTHHR